MQLPIHLLGRKGSIFGLAVAASFLLAIVPRSDAQVVLQDGNSTALINPNSQAGMFHWDIQGQNQLDQQWFWFGVDGNPVHSIDTISPPNVTPKGPNEAVITYGNPGFNVSIDYTLTGGSVVPPGQHANADIQEAIKIVNTSGTVLPFHFYQYSYFNLMNQSSDIVQLGQNLHGLYNEADQFNDSVALTETVVTPGAQRGEAEPLGVTLAKLNGGGPVSLSNNNGPVGPGQVTWALEWDFLINPGSSAIISKDKYLDIVVPEPSAFALLGLSIVGLVCRRVRSAR